MKTYSEWANEILKKVGTVGVKKLIEELQKSMNDTENDVRTNTSSSTSYNSLSHQISAIEKGNYTER